MTPLFLLLALQLMSIISFVPSTTTTSSRQTMDWLTRRRRFGEWDYWNDVYKTKTSTGFSWYCDWRDLAPLVDFLPHNNNQLLSILIPGVGTDVLPRDMFQDGFTNVTAFDYAPHGVERARELLPPQIQVLQADACNLTNVFPDNAFDLVLEKGTLDAISLSDKGLLQQAVREFSRITKPAGFLLSLSAACTPAINRTLSAELEGWTLIRNGDFYMTSDGYTSNNIDATMIVWQKNQA
jgi:SAM-dependent methyltransferase